MANCAEYARTDCASRRRLPIPLGTAPGIPGSEVLNRSGSKPFRITVKRNLPAGQVYRPGLLRRSLAYLANGDLPPVLAFVWPAREPWIPPPPPVKRRPAAKRTLADPGDRPLPLRFGSVPSCNVLERSEHVAEWIRLTEEKRVSAQLGPKSPGRPEGGINSASRELGVNRQQAQRAAKVAGLSERAKEIYEALHPETRHGGDRGNQHTGGRQSDNLSFSQDTASKTGQNRRTVERDANRGERVSNAPENQRQSAVSSHRADTALRASIAACCIVFVAFAGWAVTL